MDPKTEANHICSMIKKYWRKMGYFGIACSAVEKGEGVYEIVSNIGPNGFPPKG